MTAMVMSASSTLVNVMTAVRFHGASKWLRRSGRRVKE
jgi:hypothetical protein